MPLATSTSRFRLWRIRAVNVLTFTAFFVGSSLAISAAQGTPSVSMSMNIRHHARHHVSHSVRHHSLAHRRGHARVHHHELQLPSAVIEQWNRVAMCEEGGNWHVRGPLFSGGLGVSNRNWIEFGGLQYADNASNATPTEQIIVAMRIQQNPPDQYGCTGAW